VLAAGARVACSAQRDLDLVLTNRARHPCAPDHQVDVIEALDVRAARADEVGMLRKRRRLEAPDPIADVEPACESSLDQIREIAMPGRTVSFVRKHVRDLGMCERGAARA
jgi:hypothetical protein